MIEILCVMIAGAFGALSRWGIDRLANYFLGSTFPIGILCANVLGCLLFGFFMQLEGSLQISKNVKLLVTTGFLGAFTTFSTFGYDTFNYIKSENVPFAILNIVSNLLLGLLAVWIGSLIGKAFVN